jgi:hypothetical protein
MANPSRYFPRVLVAPTPPKPPRDRRPPPPRASIALGGGTVTAGGIPDPIHYAGADVVVTLLRRGEMAHTIGDTVRAVGKVWVHVACNSAAYVSHGRRLDYALFHKAARAVVSHVTQGRTVHVHCLEGRHRTRAVVYLAARLVGHPHNAARALVYTLRPWVNDPAWTRVLSQARAHFEGPP